MAISLNTLRSQKQTSIHGRRLALTYDDFLVGPKDMRNPVFELTSVATTQALSDHGLTMINVTSAVTTGTNAYTIPTPVPGQKVRYGQGVRGTTSTQGSTAILLSRVNTNFNIRASEGTTGVGILLPFGTMVELTGITTDAYQVTARSGLMAVSVST